MPCSGAGGSGVPSGAADCSLSASSVKVAPTVLITLKLSVSRGIAPGICSRTSVSLFQHKVAHALQLEVLSQVPDDHSAKGAETAQI